MVSRPCSSSRYQRCRTVQDRLAEPKPGHSKFLQLNHHVISALAGFPEVLSQIDTEVDVLQNRVEPRHTQNYFTQQQQREIQRFGDTKAGVEDVSNAEARSEHTSHLR